MSTPSITTTPFGKWQVTYTGKSQVAYVIHDNVLMLEFIESKTKVKIEIVGGNDYCTNDGKIEMDGLKISGSRVTDKAQLKASIVARTLTVEIRDTDGDYGKLVFTSC